MPKVHKTKKGVYVFHKGHTYFLDRAQLSVNVGALSSAPKSSGLLVSPMPGKIFKLLVMQNQSVKLGQDVVVVEAMKMEHALKAPFDGVVRKCFVTEGEQVEIGKSLIEIEPVKSAVD